LENVKRETSVVLNKLYVMEKNATVSTRSVNGKESQQNVAKETSSSDGEQFVENKTSEQQEQENNAVEFIKDVNKSPTTLDVQLSRNTLVGG